MTARHWMQIAALASALGLTGTAVAMDTDGTTSTDNGTSTSGPGMETPSSGAIVTPEDKAMGLGKGNRNGDVNDDTSTSGDDTKNDDAARVNPGRADTEDTSLSYGTPASPDIMDRDSTSTLDETDSAPARTGSDVQPGDMGPANVRGE